MSTNVLASTTSSVSARLSVSAYARMSIRVSTSALKKGPHPLHREVFWKSYGLDLRKGVTNSFAPIASVFPSDLVFASASVSATVSTNPVSLHIAESVAKCLSLQICNRVGHSFKQSLGLHIAKCVANCLSLCFCLRVSYRVD